MNKIGQSLQRKLGPLPVWAWAGLFFVGVWYYRNKLSAASGTGTGSVAPAPVTPQAQTVLQPGESVYDPNTGTLTTAPGGGGGSGDGTNPVTTPPDNSGLGGNQDIGNGNDPTQGLEDIAQAIEDAINASTSTQPGQPDAPASSKPAPRSNKKKPKRGRRRQNKRTPKGKKNHHKKTPPTKTKPHTKPRTRTRSTARVRTRGGGTVRRRRKGHTSGGLGKGAGRYRGGAKPAASRRRTLTHSTRQIVSHPTVRQRPVASATPQLTQQQIDYIRAGMRAPRLTAEQERYIYAGTHPAPRATRPRATATHRERSSSRRRR